MGRVAPTVRIKKRATQVVKVLTLVVPVVVSAFDSAPSRSKTDVRFKPLKSKQRAIRELDIDVTLKPLLLV